MGKQVKVNGVTYDVSGGKVCIPLASDPDQLADYYDVSDVDTPASSVKAGEGFYAGDEKRVGTMPVNPAVNKTLDISTPQVAVPDGYTPGGTVKIVPETKTVTPSKEAQTIAPSAGKVLASVVVEKVPATFGDISKVTAVTDDVKVGKKFVDATGALQEGTHTDPTFTLKDGALIVR